MPVALVDLGDLAAALILLLIAAALWVLIQLLTNTLGHAPLIGHWVSTDLAGWLNDARNAILRAARATWHGFLDLTNWGHALLVSWFLHVILFMGEAQSAVSRIAFVRLPELAGQVTGYALSLYHAAVSYAQQLEAQAVAFAASEVSSLERTVQGWVAAAYAYAAQLAARAEADALALVQRAEADAANAITAASTTLQAEIRDAEQIAASEVAALAAGTTAALHQLESDLVSGLSAAEALAFSQLQALQQGIITDLEQTGEAALRLAWPDAIPDIDALRQALGADFPDIQQLLRLLAGAGATGLLGALITSLAGTATVTRLATDCIVPNCRNLGGLGQFLQQLFADATDLALVAWLAEGVASPAGWARDTDTLLGSIATDTASAARTLLGA